MHRIACCVLITAALWGGPARALAAGDLLDSNALVSDLKIWWLDDHTVFFQGYDQNRREEPVVRWTRDMYSFYTWDTRTNELVPVRKTMSNLLCVSDGRVLYYGPDPSSASADWVLFSGKWGHEKRTSITRTDIVSKKATANLLSCTASTVPPQWSRFDKRPNDVRFLGGIRPLKNEHGFLRVVAGGEISGEKSSVFEIELYQPGARSPKLVAKYDDERAAAPALRVSFVPFLNRYLLQGSASVLNSAITPAWLLSPDGQLESIAPAKSPTRGIDDYYPTKRGVLFPYVSVTNHIDTSMIGAWIIASKSIERIVVGVVRNIAVSPDGCRVAFSHVIHWKAYYDGLESLRKGGPGYTTLKMIDLCRVRGKR